MNKLLIVSIAIAQLVISQTSVACKSALLGEEYPVAHSDRYKYVVVARVDKSVHSDEYRYRPLVSFEATVIESIKGDLVNGVSFTGGPKDEEEGAVCPVHLVEGGTYLLLLSKENGNYVISRFGISVKSDNKYFTGYVKQIKNAILSK